MTMRLKKDPITKYSVMTTHFSICYSRQIVEVFHEQLSKGSVYAVKDDSMYTYVPHHSNLIVVDFVLDLLQACMHNFTLLCTLHRRYYNYSYYVQISLMVYSIETILLISSIIISIS